MTRGSIRRRLVLQLALIAALLSVAFFFALRTVAERAATDTQDNILAASATSIADAVYLESGDVRLDLPYSALSMLGTISEDRVFYRVLVDGETITGYDRLPIPERAQNEPWFDTYQFRGDRLRAVSVARTLSTGNQARNVQVVVAQTRRGLAAVSSKITTAATGIGMLFFFVSTGLSVFAANSALSLPLTPIRNSL